MASINVSVLVAARNEYSDQLKRYLSPLLLEGFVSIYEDAIMKETREQGNNGQGYSFIRHFQIFLREIPRWNSSILQEETRRIQERIPFFHKLITAIFVSHVKILGSVRLGGSHRNVKIKVPTDDILIHSIYVNAAENIYTSLPILRAFEHHSERASNDQIKKLIEDSIDETVSSMVPVQNILEEYLSTVFDEDIQSEPVEPDDEEEDYEELDSKDMGLCDLDDVDQSRDANISGNRLDNRIDYSDIDDITSADMSAPKIPIFENDDLGVKSNLVTSSLKIMDLDEDEDGSINDNKFGMNTKNWDEELFGSSKDSENDSNDFSFTESAPIEEDFSFLKKEKNDSLNDFDLSSSSEKPVDFSPPSTSNDFGSNRNSDVTNHVTNDDTPTELDFSGNKTLVEDPIIEDFSFREEPKDFNKDSRNGFSEELTADMNDFGASVVEPTTPPEDSGDFGASSGDFGASSGDFGSTNVVNPSDIFGSSGSIDFDSGEDLFKTGNQGIAEDPVGFF